MSSTITSDLPTPASGGQNLLRALWIAFLCGAVVLVVAAYALSRPLHDFIEYWTTAHRLVEHQNPYSIRDTFQMQKALGWEEPVPLTFVCPPWALALIAPLGMFESYSLAWLAWFLTMTLALGAASFLLMHMYFRDIRIPEITEKNWQRSLFAFSFYPALLALKFSQTAPLLLLGLAGFLYFERKQRSVLAGVLLSLTLVKPQLLGLVWLALVLRSFQQRRWKCVAAAVGTISLLTAIALAFDYHAIQQYGELVRGPYLSLNPAGIMAAVRELFGGRNTYWMQFITPAFGVMWIAWYWRRHRLNWEWGDRMPALVAASVLTTAYGWLFDQTLLALPIIALAAYHARKEGRLPRNLVGLYTILNISLLFAAMASSPWAYVPAPILMAVLLSRSECGEGNFSLDYAAVTGRSEA